MLSTCIRLETGNVKRYTTCNMSCGNLLDLNYKSNNLETMKNIRTIVIISVFMLWENKFLGVVLRTSKNAFILIIKKRAEKYLYLWFYGLNRLNSMVGVYTLYDSRINCFNFVDNKTSKLLQKCFKAEICSKE